LAIFWNWRNTGETGETLDYLQEEVRRWRKEEGDQVHDEDEDEEVRRRMDERDQVHGGG
jgi:hypothetical protein